MNDSEIILYQSADGAIEIDVFLENETVWLTQEQMCSLFGKSKSTISEHIKHIYEENELSRDSTVRNFRTVQHEGEREVVRDLDFYNLYAIISVGYRVKSKQIIIGYQPANRCKLVFRRVDASLPLLVMKSYDKYHTASIKKAEVSNDKNYLDEDEIKNPESVAQTMTI
jgi:hypothetical protein